MSDDIDDAVDWLVVRNLAAPSRIAITGASYGGYAVLAALTRSPDRYACGVDVVGPSNLETLIDTIPAYWSPIRRAFLRSVGATTPREQETLRARSPLHRAEAIQRPLLIGHGAMDPRVKQAEADQMAAGMASNGVPVTYVLFPDEGHGFGKPVNRLCFAGLQEQFLARHLGGSAEPLSATDIARSSAEFLYDDDNLGGACLC